MTWRADVDAILASLPDDDPGVDPWGGANLDPGHKYEYIDGGSDARDPRPARPPIR